MTNESMGAPSLRDEILSYYENTEEVERLVQGSGLLEFARMVEIIRRFIPRPPGVVLDVGGGPGRYSCWLAKNGYEVHLIGPVKKHLMRARDSSGSQPLHPLASITMGDARSLKNVDGSADVVLLMGPLYHLTDRSQRLLALREAHRVLKSDGILIAKAINRFASLLDGLMQGFIDDPTFVSVMSRDLDDGQHRSNSPEYFTTAFFHRAEELKQEIIEAGFDCRHLCPVQGPGQLAADLEERMLDPAKRKQLLELIRSLEQEESLLGISSHLIVVATKQM